MKISLILLALSALAATLDAAAPSGGGLGATTGASTTWSGTGTGPSAPQGESTCVEGTTCDTFLLTLTGNPSDYAGKVVHIELDWLTIATDYDLFVHKGSATGPLVASSAQGTTNFEAVNINPSATGAGVYAVHVVYFAATPADQYRGTATVATAPSNAPQSLSPPPTYTSFQAPAALGNSAGEPSIGANWISGNAIFQAGFDTMRVTFDDTTRPATAAWVLKDATNTNITSLDPILFTDSHTGRTFVSQLLGTTSLSSFTDNDGDAYTVDQGGGIASGVDHQTFGGGPFKKCSAAQAAADPTGCAILSARGPLTAYPNAVYYASQNIGDALMALSQTGGLTFELAHPMYTILQCGGIHGHIKVAPDGSVYVPNKSCGGSQGLVVSNDNALTFTVRQVTGSTPGSGDPSVGVGAQGRIYFGYTDSSGHARITVSDDQGQTWHNDQDVGAPFNIQNSAFPEVVAGDNDRAAFFFLGTPSAGAGTADDSTGAFSGVWHGYIATTYDGGVSWVTVDATPSDPVQLGVICTNGTTCPSGTRNLLDFNDLTVDKRGRVLAAYADGCITAGCIALTDRDHDGKLTKADNDGAAKATILRQASGRGLFAAFDPVVGGNP
jgi:hypothetical protein